MKTDFLIITILKVLEYLSGIPVNLPTWGLLRYSDGDAW